MNLIESQGCSRNARRVPVEELVPVEDVVPVRVVLLEG